MKVSGFDYLYTLQGWIKSGNVPGYLSQQLSDGYSGINKYVASDYFTYGLGYFNGDYNPIDDQVELGALGEIWNGMDLDPSRPIGLYNGNIAAMVTGLKPEEGSFSQDISAYAYKYDQLHRIIQGDFFNWEMQAYNRSQINGIFPYDVSFQYDPDGNLTMLNRNGPQSTLDRLNYSYSNSQRPNQLITVNDLVGSTTYPDDIEGIHGYQYDAIGNLTSSSSERTSIQWDAYNKVRRIFNSSTGSDDYIYDASGNRVLKVRGDVTTAYLRDANGNVLNTYSIIGEGSEADIVLSEVNIYGSSRLGLANVQKNLGESPSPFDTYKRKPTQH